MPWNFQQQLLRYGPDAQGPDMDLNRARSYCAWVTRTHYENFSVASAFLPRKLAPHFHPIYAFCRWADDLGDETGGGEKSLKLLSWWREELRNAYRGKSYHPVMIALRPTLNQFLIPPLPFMELISAFEQDQTVKEYETFPQLLDYGRRSANPVGHLVLYLADAFNEETARYSDFICTALQLTNFWQDVGRDYRDLKRIYVPKEDRLRFQVSDQDWQAGRFTPEFQKLIKFEVDRTREMFLQGSPLMQLVPRKIRTDIELFQKGGLAILNKIERLGYNVWERRPKLSKWEKTKLLLGTVLNQFVRGRE